MSKTARAHRKFAIYSIYLDTWLEGEEEIREGETRQQTLERILDELEQTAEARRKKHLISQEGNPEEGIKFEYPAARPNPPVAPGGHAFRESTPQVIDYKQKENLEIQIDNAASLEDLAKLKQDAGANGLVSQYMKRLNELMVK
jgi:hypothetical protein